MVGNRQIKIFVKKMKSLGVLDTFSSPGCTKSSKFERVMIVQTHVYDEKNGGFFLFFKAFFAWKKKPLVFKAFLYDQKAVYNKECFLTKSKILKKIAQKQETYSHVHDWRK